MGAFLFAMIPTIRRELRVEPRTGVSVLPYETKKTVFTKAKQTIDNRLAGRAAKGAIPGRSYLAIPSLRSLRPHHNEVFMRNERINTSFFCIFDSFMRSKIEFFAIYPHFWRPFWRPHFNIIFPL